MESATQPPPSARVTLGRRLAAVAGIFLIVVAGIMALNLYLLRTVDPLDSPALKTLMEQLERDGSNETLRQQVRELDLLARRAFFVRQWQLETGGILLAVAGIVFVLSLHLMADNRPRLPDLKACPGRDDAWGMATRARRLIAVAGSVILVAAWILFLPAGRRSSLPDSPPAETPPAPGAAAPAAAADGPSHPVAPAVAPAQALPAEAERYWPAFRGPGGRGVAPHGDPPTAWDGTSGQGIRWKTPLPRPGFNSPVVWGNRVFLSGADEEAREVYCFDADTGALLWRADTAGVSDAPVALPRVLPDTGYAAPTVAVDGQRVFAIFATGVILALDIDGRRLWARELGTPDNHYGHSSSLLAVGDAVLVQFDQADGATLLALDAETGQTRWQQARAVDASWASPILVEAEGGLNVILAAAPTVSAYDALTGAPRWHADVFNGEIGSSPAYAAGRVFAANQYAQAVALDARTGDVLWQTTRLELPDAGSPVATAQHLFLPTSYGVFSCVDAADGTLLWEHEFDTGGYSSPVLAAGRIYWIAQDGTTHIFKADAPFELIAESALGEAAMATPAVVGGRLFIRGEAHLFCIGED